jgi:GR25 family glycosyltransferase involved in LPS biosynthesis
MIAIGNFGTYTNNTFSYLKSYWLKNKYNDSDAKTEERKFTKNYKCRFFLENTFGSTIQFSHLQNTCNKKKFFEKAYRYKDCKEYWQVSKNILDFIDQDTLNKYTEAALKYKRHEKESEYDIVYYCGGLSPLWGPDDKSLGGSEQAVVELSKYWAKMNYKVAVYSNIKKEMTFDGVNYFFDTSFLCSLKYKCLILWRSFGADTLFRYDFKADKVIIDLHDLGGTKLLIDNLDKVDYILPKSKFHAYSVYYKLPEAIKKRVQQKIRYLMNGIRIEKFQKKLDIKREPFRLCYTSCYTRGLEALLKYFFPKLKKLIPEAELHIYYGFPKPDEFKEFNHEMHKLIFNTEGVFEHGRVSVDKIIEEKYKSNFHLYYTSSTAETDCIAIRESLVAGCIPIISTKNVFHERDGLKFEYDVEKISSYEKIAIEVADCMKNMDKCDKLREALKNSETIKSWDQIGKEWLYLIKMSKESLEVFDNMNKIDKMNNIKRTFLINLKRRPDRLKQFYNLYPYKKEYVDLIEAVDGKLLNADDPRVVDYVNKYYNIRKSEPYKGAVGCSFSHEKVWRDIVSDEKLGENDLVSVFEDDCFFSDKFDLVWNVVSNNLPENTEFVYLGGRFNKNYITKKSERNKKWNKVANFLYQIKDHSLLEDRTTHAYVISKAGARKLLKSVDDYGFDIEVDKWMIDKMKNLNSYDMMPHMCWSPLDYNTDIQIRSKDNYFNIIKDFIQKNI